MSAFRKVQQRRRFTFACLVALGLLSTHACGQVTNDTKARRMLQEGRYGDAISTLDAELKRRPGDGQLLLLKGAALSLNDQKSEALDVFKTMISRRVEVASAYNNIGVINSGQGHFESARDAFQSALREKADYAIAAQNLGNVHVQLAGQAFRRALQLNRSDTSLPIKLAQIDTLLGQLTPATPVAAPAPASAPGFPEEHAFVPDRRPALLEDSAGRTAAFDRAHGR